MKQADRFGDPLKEKLDDFRYGTVSMDEMINWLKKHLTKNNFIEECDNFTKTYKQLLKKKL